MNGVAINPVGRAAPHPNLVDSVFFELSRTFADAARQGAVMPSLETMRIEVLQQRTNLDHESPFMGRRAESAWLALLHHEAGEHLAVAIGVRNIGRSEWNIEQMATFPVDLGASATTKPLHLAPPLGGVGRYVVGAVVTSPQIAAARLILADGTTFEDAADGSLLLFATLRSPEQWADLAKLQFLDRKGNIVFEERHCVAPYEVLPDPED